jgi:hypothetical protein
LHASLKRVAEQISSSPDALSKALTELESITERVDQSKLPDNQKSPLLEEISEKVDEAGTALNLAAGISLDAHIAANPETSAPPPEKDAAISVSPNQKVGIVAELRNGSKSWLNIRSAEVSPFRDWAGRVHAESTTIKPGEDYYAKFVVQIPPDAPLTRPYWHRNDPLKDSVNTVREMYDTLPLPTNRLGVRVVFDLASERRAFHTLVPDAINGYSTRKHPTANGAGTVTSLVRVPFKDESGDIRSIALAVVPAFSVALDPGEQVLPLSDGKEPTVKVGVSSNLTGAPAGKLHLELPTGWRAEPASFDVTLPKRGDKQAFSFKVFPGKLAEGRSEVHAVLDAGGKKYSEGYELVGREDIGFYYYYRPAVQHVSIVDVKIPKDLRVAYIQGAGEDTPAVLQQVGMNVTVLPAEKLGTEDLSQFGSIVLGVRAYDAQKDVVANNAKLLKFVSDGGTLVVEHNNDIGDFNSAHYTPYPVQLGRARVSVEQAPVQILAPDNPVFHFPNEITQKDFDGWVQERGLYFMSSWDEHFKPLISCHDPNEPDQKGGLLMAKYGKGTYIYSGYSFYRELPAGVPGAVRLFVNLVSAGHGH